MNYDSSTPSSLLVQCRKNAKGSWETLSTLYGKLIWHWCRTAGLSETDCDEVYQEVFLSVIRHIHSFHKNKPGQKFRGWLKSITTSRISDFYRKQKKVSQLIGEIRYHHPLEREIILPDDEVTEKTLLYRQLMKILRKDFSERDIEVFKRVRTSTGLTSREIGEEFGLTAATVRQIVYRIQKQIREEFGDVL
ncbi:MAG: sigma-70 family RNA polymerase sigma factor [Planctomycetaceae bacterium]|nr:sigma-70 family RNA polymerase sigma factor [Planctomycetaceae bacterium]MBQ2821718.1 sigma-70 family RNA polymerase sigma factor [Thermoguttaceae bacterium]